MIDSLDSITLSRRWLRCLSSSKKYSRGWYRHGKGPCRLVVRYSSRSCRLCNTDHWGCPSANWTYRCIADRKVPKVSNHHPHSRLYASQCLFSILLWSGDWLSPCRLTDIRWLFAYFWLWRILLWRNSICRCSACSWSSQRYCRCKMQVGDRIFALCQSI